MPKHDRTWYDDSVLIREPRPHIVAATRPLREGMEDAVNFGTRVLDWIMTEVPTGEQSIHPRIIVCTLYRHMLDLADATTALIPLGQAASSRCLMRSIVEVYLSIEYMLQADAARRSRAYYFMGLQERLWWYKRTGSNRPESTELFARLERDRLSQYMHLPTSDNDTIISEATALLNSQSYQSEVAEHAALKAKNAKRGIRWYMFYNGPQSVHAMAECVGHRWLYEFVYRTASEDVHASDVGKTLSIDGENLKMRMLRHPSGIDTVAHLCAALLYHISLTIIDAILPSFQQKYTDAYSLVYRDSFRRLRDCNLHLSE